MNGYRRMIRTITESKEVDQLFDSKYPGHLDEKYNSKQNKDLLEKVNKLFELYTPMKKDTSNYVEGMAKSNVDLDINVSFRTGTIILKDLGGKQVFRCSLKDINKLISWYKANLNKYKE